MKPKKNIYIINSKSRLLYLYIESSSRVHAFAKENEYLGVHEARELHFSFYLKKHVL